MLCGRKALAPSGAAPHHLSGRPASGTPPDGRTAVRSGVQGDGGSRIFFVPQVTTQRPAVPQALLS